MWTVDRRRGALAAIVVSASVLAVAAPAGLGAGDYEQPVPPADADTVADTTPPETIKGAGPKKRIRARRARFHFSSEPGALFRCALDGRLLRRCASPVKVIHLSRGRHTFTATAIDAALNADPTPARWRFKVVRR